MLHYSQPWSVLLPAPKAPCHSRWNSYVGLPTDIALRMTPTIGLKVPLTTSLPPNDPTLQTFVLDKIRGMMDGAKSPIIIVDGGMNVWILHIHLFCDWLLIGAARNRLEKEAYSLIESTGYPYFITAMAKGSVSEHLPTYGGVYGGAGSFPEIKNIVESSDCVLWLGNYPVSISIDSRWL